MTDISTAEKNGEPSSLRSEGLPVLPPPVAWIEIFLLVVVPVLLDRWMPGFPPLQDMQPHLFWLPVLLLSLQYGTVSGLITAGLAIVLSGVLGWPDQEIGENHFSYLLRVSAQPVLWLMAALILGQFRSRQIERQLELARKIDEATSQRAAIADHCAKLKVRCDLLERRLANGDASGNQRLVAALAHLGKRRDDRDGDTAPSLPDGATAAFDHVLGLAFGQCQASLFVKERSELKLLHAFAWPSAATWRAVLDPSHPLFTAVITDGRSVCVLRPGDEEVLGGQGLAAVPVFSRSSDDIIGLLKVESADPAQLNADMLAVLELLASRLSVMIESRGSVIGVSRLAMAQDLPPNAATPRQRVWRQLKWRTASDGPARMISRNG